MDWSSDLRSLRSELDSLRRERQRQARAEEADRERRFTQAREVFQSLRVEESLNEMNRLLLDGQGDLRLYAPWEVEEDAESGYDDVVDDDEDFDEEEGEVFSAILTWEEGGTREIAVDIGMTEKGFYLQVNGDDVRSPDEGSVRQSLIRALREEIGL